MEALRAAGHPPTVPLQIGALVDRELASPGPARMPIQRNLYARQMLLQLLRSLLT